MNNHAQRIKDLVRSHLNVSDDQIRFAEDVREGLRIGEKVVKSGLITAQNGSCLCLWLLLACGIVVVIWLSWRVR